MAPMSPPPMAANVMLEEMVCISLLHIFFPYCTHSDALMHTVLQSTPVLPVMYNPLQVDCNLPLKPTYSDEPNILQALAHTPMEHLDKLRIYLGLTRMLKYQLPAEIQKVLILNCAPLKFATQKLEQDFVEMRKTDEHMNADLFRLLLDLARYRV